MPHAELARGAHLGLDQAARAAREDVVVVEDGRAAGERELGEPVRAAAYTDSSSMPRPDRIERREPREEVGLLRPGARQGLVEVVVRVDEAGRDDRAAEVDALVGLGRRAAADRLDAAVREEHPAVRVLRARVVHHDDVRAGEQQAHSRPAGRARSARRRRARGR